MFLTIKEIKDFTFPETESDLRANEHHDPTYYLKNWKLLTTKFSSQKLQGKSLQGP